MATENFGSSHKQSTRGGAIKMKAPSKQSTAQLLRRYNKLVEEHDVLVERFHHLKDEILRNRHSKELNSELLEGEHIFKRDNRYSEKKKADS